MMGWKGRVLQILMEWKLVLACKAINLTLKSESQEDICTGCCSNSSNKQCMLLEDYNVCLVSSSHVLQDNLHRKNTNYNVVNVK